MVINTRGFTHLVALVTITVIAIAMIGVMAWFRNEANEQTTNSNISNTNQTVTNTTTNTTTNTSSNTNTTTNASANTNSSIVPGARACVTDSDCELHMCSGCLAKDYLETNPPLPACAIYNSQYSCVCQAGECKEKSSSTSDWQTYTNDVYSIRYPSGWESKADLVNANGMIRVASFRPVTVKEDWLWGIWEYDTTKTIDALAVEQGKQFSDRVEKRETVTVDGVSATKVTVTTPSYADQVYTIIYIPTAKGLIAVSDGAVQEFPFGDFLSTFQFSN